MLQWVSGTVFISTAFAILGLTWQIKELNSLFLFLSVSFSLYIIWLVIQGRYQDYVNIILDRIWKLEGLMCLNLHLQIKQQDDRELKKKPIRHSLKRMHYWTHYIMPIFLGFLWIFRVVFT